MKIYLITNYLLLTVFDNEIEGVGLDPSIRLSYVNTFYNLACVQ